MPLACNSLTFSHAVQMVFSGSWQVSLTSACPWNIHGWMAFRWEVNCPPLYEQCRWRQKECTGFPHLIKSSYMYHLFLLFLPCSLLKHHRTFMCPKSRLLCYLHCFIITLRIYTEKEPLFFFIEKHRLFVIVLTLLYIILKSLELFTCY